MSNSHNSPILVIEDNDEDFLMINRGFEHAGIITKIIRLKDVAQALDWLQEKNSKASIIMLDLNLPGGSGHQIISAFKNHKTHKSTPIVVLSTSASPKDINICYDLGANSYHSKPLETPQFHKIVSEVADYWLGKAILTGSAK